jgi:hypothetical protein
MRFEHAECNEQHKLVAVIVGPNNLPQTDNIIERELALEGDQYPSINRSALPHGCPVLLYTPEAKEQVKAVSFL